MSAADKPSPSPGTPGAGRGEASLLSTADLDSRKSAHPNPSPRPLRGSPEYRARGAAIPLLIAVVIFSLFSVTCAITSDGFLEADSCTHYLYARFAFAEPHYLVNVWGRPLCTGIYAIPAYLAGRAGVQWTSLLLAITCAVAATQIARRLGFRHPALAGIFL